MPTADYPSDAPGVEAVSVCSLGPAGDAAPRAL